MCPLANSTILHPKDTFLQDSIRINVIDTISCLHICPDSNKVEKIRLSGIKTSISIMAVK